LKLTGISSILNPKPNTLVFKTNSDKLNNINYTIITEKAGKNISNYSYIVVKHPFISFIKACELFGIKSEEPDIHPSAIITNTEIGNNVTIQAGCVIGEEGFGFYKNNTGNLLNFPHIGKVLIKDNVSIFTNTTIARGALEDTVIGEGTKIASLVMIGHGVNIGMNNIICAQVNISGKTKIGNNCFIGLKACIRDNIEIGSNVTIGMGSVVTKNIPDNATVFGNPATIKDFS